MRLKSWAVLVGVLVLSAGAQAQTTARVSLATGGAQGNNWSVQPSISADGRFVAFGSFASNLVPGDTNGTYEVFVHDRQTGQTQRVSRATGGAQGDGQSSDPSISADGRFVAFQSNATNLVPGDTNRTDDVFVHDRQTGETQRLSLATGGAQGNEWSESPSISADGRFVAFTSWASTLVPGDTNNTYDVFVHDRQTGETSIVSVATGGAQGDRRSQFPRISADGRFVAFNSAASNLVPGDTNGLDVFVHDRQTGETSIVSVATGGAQGNGNSWDSSISADGRFVAFDSVASNLVPGDTNGWVDAFVHDRQTATTTRVSLATGGTQGNSDSYDSSLSADGRFVAFVSLAFNLVPGDTNNTYDVFVHDRQTGETSIVSVATGGAQGNGDSYWPSISADGRFVAFSSWDSTLVPDDTNGEYDIFVHDRCAVFPCAGDADGSGSVTFADITSILENWSMNYVPCTGPGDANHDSTVNFSDITKVLENWGVACP